MDHVNIILATYNGEQYISEQIDSILNNSFKDWKLWIFDDGSTDRTISIIDEYVTEYPDKIMFHCNTRNKGVTLNFLEGVFYASEKEEIAKISATKVYYMFCDQDDVWMQDKIERTLNRMKKVEKKVAKNSPVAVFTDALVVDDKLKTLHSSFFHTSNLDAKKVDLPHILMENKLIGCTVMFNDQLKKRMSCIPQNARFHDWWIALIAAAFGSINFFPEPTLLYRQHSNNVVGNQSFFFYIKNRISTLQRQREVLHKNVSQAKEFYQIYQKDLTEKNKNILDTFAHIENDSWIRRRIVILKYGYLKTGIIRNIGLLWLI